MLSLCLSRTITNSDAFALYLFYNTERRYKLTHYDNLVSLLKEMGGVVIGYSGGVDSTLLAKVSTDSLGKQAVCVLVESLLIPDSEIDEAVSLAEEYNFNLIRLKVDVLAVEKVPDNDPQRCYFCKKAVFSHLVKIAQDMGLPYVLDGSNATDESDYRPGSKATKELQVRSPLKELGITKEEIRAISRDLGLATWNKPSLACLASRIPYGTALTNELLKQVGDAETILRRLGFKQFRVRHHGDLARIELLPLDMEKLVTPAMRKYVVEQFSALGYTYVSMDLYGYRTGSMNETILD